MPEGESENSLSTISANSSSDIQDVPKVSILMDTGSAIPIA